MQRQVTRPALKALFPAEARRDKAVRNAAIREAFVDYGYRLKEIGDHLGLHYATVCRIVKERGR